MCQLGHGDGFGHVDFQRARFYRCSMAVVGVAIVAVIATTAIGTSTAATLTAAPRARTIGTGCTTGVATGRNTFFLGRIARPTGRQLGRFDFFASTSARSGRTWRTGIARTGRDYWLV